jgi:hypothetical protein
LQNRGFYPKDAKKLLQQTASLPDVVVRDARVSRLHLEFDVSAEENELNAFLKRLESIAPVVMHTEIADKKMDKDQAIRHARELFNGERYWECHEVLEGVWKNSSGTEKLLSQGIILTCAAFVHSQKDEDDVCFSILNRALEKFTDVKGIYHEIDMDRFKHAIESIVAGRKIEYFNV